MTWIIRLSKFICACIACLVSRRHHTMARLMQKQQHGFCARQAVCHICCCWLLRHKMKMCVQYIVQAVACCMTSGTTALQCQC